MGDGTDDVIVHLVPLRRRHLRSVLRIESEVYPKPWSFALFMSELNLRGTRHYVAARAEGNVIGYAGLMFALDEAHITTIAVDPAWQRQKVGTRLMAHLARVAIARGSRHITLEVRLSNSPAQAMYRRFRFDTEGVRKNYYADANEDALVMWARHVDEPDYLKLLDELESGLAESTVDTAR